MPAQNLENLAKAGQLKQEPPGRKEFENLIGSGRTRLKDASNKQLALESRFDLAYNAAHAIALAALRWHGYRSENRYLVFQCLAHTLSFAPSEWRVLALAHERRNLREYQGELNVDERLVGELISVARVALAMAEKLGPPRMADRPR
jgi:hypothetical protein